MIDTLEIASALAHEMDMLARAANDPAQRHIWFWQSPRALVVPRSLSVRSGFKDAQIQLENAGWPVVIRATGGDVTPQGPEIVNVSLIYTSDGPPDVNATYDRLCAPMERCLGSGASRGWNPGAFCDGAYNVQMNGLKFAGTAQRFKRCPGQDRTAVLSHALMLLRPPAQEAIEAVNRLLNLMGEAREINIAAHTGLPANISPDSFIAELHAAYIQALP